MRSVKILLPFVGCFWITCLASVEPAQNAPGRADVNILQNRIAHRFQVLDELRKDARFVYSIERSLRQHPRDGAMTYDVLLVNTRTGKMAMKIYKPEHSEEDLAMSLVLTDYLGGLGIVPKLYGYLPHVETVRILTQHLAVDNADASVSFAVLVEFVDGAWNFARDQNVPPQLKTWNLPAMVDRMVFFQHTLDALRIKANDTQYFISSTGQIYLFDLDHFNWISPQNELWGYPAPFTIQEEDLANLKARYRDAPIPVENDFSFDIEYLQRLFADHR